MAGERFQGTAADERRGGNLPARLRFTARRGVTLIELMIAMLILALVCVSWLEIIGIQSAKKEARRREAVERLAGMMDAFLYLNRSPMDIQTDGYYQAKKNGNSFWFGESDRRNFLPVFDGDTTICYQLHIVRKESLLELGLAADNAWGEDVGWLVGQLFEQKGSGYLPYFTVSVCTGLMLWY